MKIHRANGIKKTKRNRNFITYPNSATNTLAP
jgi:hypothetical protein